MPIADQAALPPPAPIPAWHQGVLAQRRKEIAKGRALPWDEVPASAAAPEPLHHAEELMGVVPADRLLSVPDGTRILVAGAVTHRQRPATAQGVTFMNLEDETGMVNVLCSPGVWSRHRRLAQTASALMVRGIVQNASGAVTVPAEGSVLPQTYAFERGMAREAILRRAQLAMDKEVAAAWAARAPNLPLSTPRDMVILASIVERETAKPDERPHIAAVYLNRLSDLLFILARTANAGRGEPGWVPGGTRD